MPSHPKILFVTYGGGHADIVARILRELTGLDANIKPVVLSLTTATARLRDANVILRQCLDYIPIEGYEDALEIGAEIAESFWDPSSGVSWKETCAYIGVSMCDLQADKGRDQARALFQKNGRRAFLPIHFLDKVLSVEQPDIVVTTCHVRMERAAVLAAKARGITTVRIEDLFGFSLLNLENQDANELISLEEWPDKVVVINRLVREDFVKLGFPSERLFPFGQPVISDWYKEYEAAEVPEVLKHKMQGRPLITHIAPARRDVLYSQVEELVDLARLRQDWLFCIKLHPSVGAEEFKSQAPTMSGNMIVLAQEVPIVNIVKATDVALTFRSTAGLLCIHSGTPLIVWDETGEPMEMPYVDLGAATLVSSNMRLEETIESMLSVANSNSITKTHPLFETSITAARDIAGWLLTL